MSDYTLGPLPWSEKRLREAYFRDFLETRKAIQQHPGFQAHRDLCSLELSLDIFRACVSDLLQSIEAFGADAESADFWARPSRPKFTSRELSVWRALFAAASSAMALVDHARRVQDRVGIAAYHDKVKEFFDEEESRFVQKLRVCLTHILMITPSWQRTFSDAGRQTRFLLGQEALLQCDEWDGPARSFISHHPEGVDVEEFFRRYQSRVESFQEWLQDEVRRASEPQLSQYREYERMLNGFDAQAWWNIVLEQVINLGLDPYSYLRKYLTHDELDEVQALPKRSREQVDRIIEILDEFGSCTEELRARAYEAFGIDTNG